MAPRVSATLYLVSCVSLVALAACGGETTDSQPGVCPDNRLENAVEASTWATERAGIHTYAYTADLAGGVAEVDLLDADHASLGTLAVRQRFGSDDPDGVMEGVLGGSAAPARLVTRGEQLGSDGYTVRMRLEPDDDAPSLHLTARFETRQCWLVDEPAAGPPCASGLPLDSPPFTLPTCGLVADERIRREQPPALARLTYAVDAETADASPSSGGSRRAGGQLFYQLDVLDAEGPASTQRVEQWLRETGLERLVGTDHERLLTTAFLDRTWWRTLDEHVTHCDIQQLPRPEGSADEQGDEPSDEESERESDSRTATMSLCPGDHDSDAWGSGDDSTGGEVWGDPHLVTFDGHAYDFQAAGEFVVFEADGEEPLLVQGRFEPLEDVPVPECGELTVNTAAATEIDGRRVVARMRPDWQVRIDGDPVDGPDDVPELDEGASIELADRGVTVGWPDGAEVSFTLRSGTTADSLTIDASLPPDRRGQVGGLLGQFDGDPSNDLVLPDGSLLDQPASFEQLYELLAPAWRVDPDHSLFDYVDGESPESFHLEDFPDSPVTLDDLPDDLRDEAETTCRDEGVDDAHLLDTCIVDVVCTDDDEQAAPSADAEAPISSQPPGRHDLSVERAARLVPAPDTVDADADPPAETCRTDPDPTIAVFDEQTSVSLDEDLDVDLADPGSYGVDDDPDPTTLSAGTELDSYHVVRRPTASPDFPYTGGIRFARPIVGVLVDASAVASSDETFGLPETSYPTDGFAGLRTGDDLVEIGDDGHSIDLLLKGEDAHRLRILTEAAGAETD